MQLAWKLLLPARPGQERELETIHRRIDVLWNRFEDADEAEEARILEEIDRLKMHRNALSQHLELPMQLANAPRLGIDPRAEAWLREQRDVFAENGSWSGTPPWEDFVAAYVEQWKGAYIVGASNPLAMPIPAAAEELTGPYGLDVSYLFELEGFDQELLEEAAVRHDANEMLDYKGRLLVAIHPLATQADPDPDTQMVIGLIVTTANWLTFWAEHGFGFEPIDGSVSES